MFKNKNVEALLKELQKKQLVIAYCCCGTKKTTSTAC